MKLKFNQLTSKCSICKKILTKDKFHKSNTSIHRVQYECIVCKKSIRKKASPEQSKKQNLKHFYGISVEDYNLKLSTQGDVCDSCGKPETSRRRNGELFALSVDHNHDTGEIRGLLCFACNCSLGKLRDNLETIQKLYNYRKKFE